MVKKIHEVETEFCFCNRCKEVITEKYYSLQIAHSKYTLCTKCFRKNKRKIKSHNPKYQKLFLNKQTMKQSTNKLLGFLFAVVCFVILSMMVYGVAEAYLGGKSPQTPFAQKTYDSTTYAQCVSHSALGSAKLADYFDGFHDASDEDILRWKEAKEKDCTLLWKAFQ